MSDEKKILNLIRKKSGLIDAIINAMDKATDAAGRALYGLIISDFMDRLERDGAGRIKNTVVNKRRVALLDRVYKNFNNENGVKLIALIADSVETILTFNEKYYGSFVPAGEIGDIFQGTRNIVADWLGLTRRGGLVENGYLQRLVSDQSIRNVIQNDTYKSIITQRGYNETKKALGVFIQGNAEKAGALQRYYRNFVYDTFSQVDRTQSKIVADKLKLTYAIYEGGLVEKSRSFCIKRNGKVFTSEEIAEFNPKEAKPPNYNPFTDLGGYGCRHHLNYIPELVAIALRPDLKKVN